MKALEEFFHLKEHKTSVKTELIAGVTTFLAMAYILGVNPGILSATGMSMTSVFMATAISAGIASILMGLIANYPVALASGMGVNALFAYTVCGAMGYSWAAALCAVFISGIIFVLISVTGVRKKIIDAIPVQLKLAIGAGIGFFIAFVGLKNAEIIVANEGTLVGLGDLGNPTVLLAIFGILITIVCVMRNVPAAVFVGLIITAALGLVIGLFGIEGMPTLVFAAPDFTMEGFGACFAGFGELFANPMSALLVIFSFLFVDFFDTAGTLVAIGNEIGLVNDKGELENAEQALLADSLGTVFGAVLGTSTVTSFVESSSGVGVGGRTGLTACTTGVLFLLSIFISPFILGLVTSSVTTPALVVVGVMMAQQLRQIEWNNMLYAIPAFVIVITMILTYSISNGIALGFLTYVVCMLSAGKAKDITLTVWLLCIVFLLYFCL